MLCDRYVYFQYIFLDDVMNFSVTIYHTNDRFQKIPATLVYGKVNCGKTMEIKATLSMVGAQNTNWFQAISDPKRYRHVHIQ